MRDFAGVDRPPSTHAEIQAIAVAEVRERPGHYGFRQLARTLADEACCACDLRSATLALQAAVDGGLLVVSAAGVVGLPENAE